MEQVFRKSFLEGFSSVDIGPKAALAAVGIAVCFGIYIFLIYRLVTKKTFYSKTFNISLAVITVITASIILTIQSSVVVSLGMVGALSIVRFRTAVKDPMDLIFMFWSISTGIICGAGLAQIAVISSIAITVLIIALEKVPMLKAPMLLIINANNIDCEEEIIKCINKYEKNYVVKSRNITKSNLDEVIEIRTKNDVALLKEILNVEGVMSATLMKHDGEATFS